VGRWEDNSREALRSKRNARVRTPNLSLERRCSGLDMGACRCLGHRERRSIHKPNLETITRRVRTRADPPLRPQTRTGGLSAGTLRFRPSSAERQTACSCVRRSARSSVRSHCGDPLPKARGNRNSGGMGSEDAICRADRSQFVRLSAQILWRPERPTLPAGTGVPVRILIRSPPRSAKRRYVSRHNLECLHAPQLHSRSRLQAAGPMPIRTLPSVAGPKGKKATLGLMKKFPALPVSRTFDS